MKLDITKIVAILEEMPIPKLIPKRSLNSRINYGNGYGNLTVREHLTIFYKEIHKNLDKYTDVKEEHKIIFKSMRPGRFVELMLAVEDHYFQQIMLCWTN
tara:strand:+ start:412 stop:711 length:300 start_codon:yes stop_codon:yes gene_type:complete